MKKVSCFLVCICLILTACHREKTLYKIGVSQCSQDEWREKQNDEMRREASFYEGVELEIRSVKDDNEQQIRDIRYFVESGMDLIIVSPNEAVAITPVVEEAYRKGIPIIVTDRKINSDQYTAYIGADNREIGRSAGEFVLSLPFHSLQLFLIKGRRGATSAMERSAGLEEVLKDSEKEIIRVGDVDAGWNMEEAERLMDSVFAVQKEIDVVVAQNDRMAIGAWRSACKYGLEKNILFTGVDALTADGLGVDQVLSGNLAATFIYPTGGDKVIQTALRILRGEKFVRETILSTAQVDLRNARIMMLQDELIQDESQRITRLSKKLDAFLQDYNLQQLLLGASIIIVVLLLLLCGGAMYAYWTKNRINQLLQKRNNEICSQRDQLAEQRDQLVALSREVEEATQAKLTFFTNVSHDLRTPLTLIADPVAQMVAEGPRTETQRILLPVIERNMAVLLKLINQILDFQKYEDGKLQLSLSEFNLSEQLQEWNRAFSGSALHRHIRLILSVGTEPVQVLLDEAKMERIYYNLMSNAMKYTPENGEIRTMLSVQEQDGEPWFELRVADTGEGIPHEQIRDIFNRFYQANTHHAGSGIGLALVKAFVEMHQGTVTVESNHEQGTVFVIRMPIRRMPDRLTDMKSEAKPTDVRTEEITQGILRELPCEQDIYAEVPACTGEERAQPLILMVDDNPEICIYVRDWLTSHHYRVICAANGKEGMAKALRYVPDLVVSDMMMPVMDGLELVRELKNEIQTSHIPIILLTACALDEQRIQGFDEGADSYISKPFNARLLLSRIANLLANRKRLKNFFGERTLLRLEDISESDKGFVERFRELLEHRMGDSELRVDDLGAEMGLSRTQLYRKLKALTNYSPVELLRIARLKRARMLLGSTQKSVSEIAYEVGFSSPSYFNKCYKEEFGEVPNEMVKKRLQN